MTDISTPSAGIDISKATLDMAIMGRASVTHVPNDLPGWKQLGKELKAAGATRVGLEATGGYERGVMRHLRAEGFTVSLLQPLQVKFFGMMRLKRAKTDRIDAQLIAACTQFLGDQNRMPPDPRFEAFADHLTFIEQVEEDIVRYKTRLEHVTDTRLRRKMEAAIRREQALRADEMKRLVKTLCEHEDLAERRLLVLSVPTVGERTALTLLVRMPELGQISREQAAALAGLAPTVRESGKWKGQTHIGGGRVQVRRSLYVAAFPGAHHWNPALIAMRTRLQERGMSHTAAIVACARKLLIQVNAVVARGTAWEDRTAPAG